MRYRSKPVETRYVEALHDSVANQYILQHVTRDGRKTDEPLQFMTKEEFLETYEPVVRKPRPVITDASAKDDKKK